jgi:hypothetical protein
VRPHQRAIGGSTTFSTRAFVSSAGKNYVLAVGTTQTVGALLEIAGTTPDPIQFRSGAPGQVANVDLLPAGTQQIQHVGVTDVWATGQHLAPALTNEGGSGNAFRWFGSAIGADVRPVPTLGDSRRSPWPRCSRIRHPESAPARPHSRADATPSLRPRKPQ